MDPTPYILQSNLVPADHQIPQDNTPYILQSNLVPVANQNPSEGDLVGFRAKGNVYTVASDMKVDGWITIDLVGFRAKGNVYTVASDMKIAWKE